MALPYLLSSEEYFDFNNEYYIFSLLVVLTGFGFEFAYYRFPTSLLNLLKMLVLNSAIFLTILYFGGLIRRIDLNLLIIVLTSFAFIIVNVFQFTLLFNKQKKKYFVFSLIFYSIFLLSIPVLPKTRKYDYNMKSVELTAENISKYDLILVSTDHDDYKESLDLIHKNAQAILDTRNMFDGYKVFKG